MGKLEVIIKVAETVENVGARNDALSATVAMDTAEWLYNLLQMAGERQITTITTCGISKQWEQSGGYNRQRQQKNVTDSGRKRDVDEAFPEDYNESNENDF